MEERRNLRREIAKVVGQIKDGNRPTSRELSDVLGVSTAECELVLSSADAWLYRETVDGLLEQLRTGFLEGVEPIATLDGRKKS